MRRQSRAESFYLICREASRSPWIFLAALRGVDEPKTPELSPDSPEPVLVLGGFLSYPFYYAPLGRTLARHGYTVHLDDVFNAGPLRAHLARLKRRIEAIAEACASPVHIVGHSLGGIYAMALLAERPESVGQVVAVASPVVGGTPWPPLQKLVERILKARVRDARRLLRRLAPYVGQLTTICFPEDAIAPPLACAIDGARNVVLTDISRSDRALASHGGVIFMRATMTGVLEGLRPRSVTGAELPTTRMPVAV